MDIYKKIRFLIYKIKRGTILDEFISAVEQIEYMKDGEESEIMVKITKYFGKLIINFRNS